MSEHVVDLALNIRSPQWEDQTQHPRPEQRARAVTLGMLSQIEVVDLQMYQQTEDPDILQRIKSAEGRFADIYIWTDVIWRRVRRAADSRTDDDNSIQRCTAFPHESKRSSFYLCQNACSA